jgi:DNA topoisomerase-3
VFDNSKVTDHHAIIPTGETANLNSLNDYERKVYDLILRRFCAVFYPNCEYAQTSVLAVAGGVDFKATGRTILSEGWKAVYAKTQKDEEEEEKEPGENGILPAFTCGECGPHRPSLTQKMTIPPKRYTEATLLQAMETAGKFVDDETLREAMKENGIGRPSSRASIIETLLKRQYIRREKKNLLSTQAGRHLIATIQARMLKSPELTGQWEKKLRDIEHGSFTLEKFMKELQTQLVNIIKDVQSDCSERRIFSTPVPIKPSAPSGTTTRNPPSKKSKPGDRCPICGKGYVRKGPYGLFCSDYKISGCKFRKKE